MSDEQQQQQQPIYIEWATTDELLLELRKRNLNFVFAGISRITDGYNRLAFPADMPYSMARKLLKGAYETLRNAEALEEMNQLPPETQRGWF